jgi:acyl-CoA synthetase (AMP-forming)/AMP-acid ligase II
MKKLIIFTCLFAALSATASNPPEVSEKVLKAFSETFMKATEVVWHEVQNLYEASFKQSEVISRAIYDQDGNLLRTTRYYSQENLPINILTKLQKRFAGKSVYGVTELSTDDEVSYHITMQDEKNWYIIKADNWGSLELEKKYKKA